jgi:hypothetical protein
MILKKYLLGMAVLVLLVFSAQAFAQNAAITGIITDATGGVIPGAKVTATNEATNVKQEVTTSNSGVYNFNLPVGKYTVVAEMTGFGTQTRKEIELLTSSQLRINFTMAVKELKAEVIDVNVKNENLILESGSSIGMVIPEDQIAKLPLVNNNVMDLVKVMGGVVYTNLSQIFYGDQNTIAGVTADKIDIRKDGVSASEVRWPTGFSTPVNLNPDLISEFKVVMQPVDAELGRGAGQIQVVTRSGANAFRGAANWNVMNSALNSNTWSNNKAVPKIWPTWANQQNLSVNVGGPIIKNKTFFFVLFEYNSNLTKTNNVTVQMPTPCARKGIYRYFDGYVNQPFQYNPTDPAAKNAQGNNNLNRTANFFQRAVVDWDGTPVKNLPLPSYVPDASGVYGSYTGRSTTGTDAPGSTNPNPSGQLSVLHAYSPFGVIKQAIASSGGTGTWDPAKDINCDLVQVVTDKSNPLYGLPTTAWVDYTGSNTTGIGSTWDANRAPDKSGYVQKFLDLTQKPNIYNTGDGLNWGGYKWTRTNHGQDNVYGVGEGPNRKQINVRIDHNFSTRHRLGVSYAYEKDKSDDVQRTMPQNSYGGKVVRTPQTLSATLTSTLKPTLLNELRIGLTRGQSFVTSPLNQPDTGKELTDLLYGLLPTATWPSFQNLKTTFPVIVSLPNFAVGSSSNFHPYGSDRGGASMIGQDWGSSDPRWSYADTITLTVGRHSLRFGGETQRTQSNYHATGDLGSNMVYPIVTQGTPAGATSGGTGAVISTLYNATANTWTLPGTVGSSASNGSMNGFSTMMNLFSGSMASIRQYFFINSPTATRYNNISDGEIWRQQNFRINSFDFFVQDNWRVTDDLTLNLGMRYEWYGVPFNANGMTGGYVGGPSAVLGLTGRSLEHWLNLDYNPGTDTDINKAYRNCKDGSGAVDATGKCSGAVYTFIGPGSPNPGMSFYNNDNNNFGPVFGFAYTLPWGGKGKTVLRGGLQINYTAFGRASTALPDIPGVSQTYSYSNGGAYMDLTSVSSKIPIALPTNVVPPALVVPSPVDYHSGTATVYDPNIRTPYTQGLNMILTRTIGSNLTLDVRYAGNLSRKQTRQLNLNSVNMLSTGLLNAMVEMRKGGNPAIMDKILYGVNVGGATSGGTPWGRIGKDINPRTGEVFHAGEELRTNNTVCWSAYNYYTSTCLASGYFGTFAQWLSTANLNTAWNPKSGPGDTQVPQAATNSYGQILRVAGMPDNLLTANPQFGTVNWTGNFDHANYHSMQAQLTMRPTHGLGLSATFTWMRNMGMSAPADFSNRAQEYGVLGASKSVTSYGTFDLPFGPNRWLLSSVSPNILGRIIGGWQLSWIHTMSTGSLMSAYATFPYLWGGNQPNIVGPFDNKSGYVSWKPGAATGQYFGGKYTYVADPQCVNPNIVMQLPAGQQSQCYMGAVALASDVSKLIFTQPTTGIRGNYTNNQIPGPGSWNTDGAMSKSVRLTEGKSLQFRVDATNVFNHQQIAAPDMYVTTYYYLGNISGGKSGQRKFQAKVRLDF